MINPKDYETYKINDSVCEHVREEIETPIVETGLEDSGNSAGSLTFSEKMEYYKQHAEQ